MASRASWRLAIGSLRPTGATGTRSRSESIRRRLLDEMLGRATGVNGGRAGSMNINSPRDRLIGSFGIVGGTIAAATGVALALKRVGGVAVCQFGDGAINQGYFHECLNFCAVLRLPVVFLCENNGYGEYTPFQDVTAGAIRARAEAMEVPAETVDGMSVVDVRAAAGPAVAHARAGGGPYFLEAITYRYVGHSRSDPGAYRPPASSTHGRSATRSRGSAGELARRRASTRRPSTRSTPRSARMLEEMSARASRLRSRSRGRPGSSAGDAERPADAAPVGLDERGDDRRLVEATGEPFARGEALVEVETDKATIVYEAEADGSLGEILVPEGGTAALGEPIARLGGTDGRWRLPPEADGGRARDDDGGGATGCYVAGDSTDAALPGGQRARATPVARRTAVQLGVSLHGLTGTGPGGRIRKQDVLHAGSARRGPRIRATSKAPPPWSSCRRPARRSPGA